MAMVADSSIERLISEMELSTVTEKSPAQTPVIQNSYGHYRRIGSIGFNGEKTPGEIGPTRDYFPDYDTLRIRSWQLYLESEIAQIILGKYNRWVIGSGLKVQSEPDEDVLRSEGISIDTEKFRKLVEARFKVYSKSRMSDWADMTNLNKLAVRAHKNAKIGGDLLVVLRYVKEDQSIKIQLIDGQHVRSPLYGSELFPIELDNGNRIINGIEINDRGTHVAYHVIKNYMTNETERISARGARTDMVSAFMVYGNEYRLDNYRGMPLLSVMFETAKKLERYKEATVASAEERAKIVLAIEHDVYSTGENPFLKQVVQAMDVDYANNLGDKMVPRDDFGNALQDKIAATTKRMTYNLPLGAHLKALDTKNDLYFKEFYNENIMLFCAAAGIPYEVAMAMYNSNYSASRAAIKDWEHTLVTDRNDFGFQFYQPIYDFWLEVQILLGKVKAPGYLKALQDNNRLAMEAYRTARFVGPAVPHIDPEKEAKAERVKLGTAMDATPLTSLEQSIEALNGGDADLILESTAQYLKKSKSLGLKVEEPKPVGGKPGANKPAKK